jgi:hypothetical protein
VEHKTERQEREDPRAWNDSRERQPAASARVTTAARVLGFREKVREARPSKKIVFSLMVAAALLTMIAGFNWGGWVTGGTALQRANTGARDAVLSRLTPICVAQFNLDAQRGAKLDELKAITSSRERPEYVKTQGWATMPGEQTPDNDVANACARLLMAS